MIVDNTPLFRARAKMVQAREAARVKKEVGADEGTKKDLDETAKKPPISKPMPVSPKFLSYSTKAAEIRRDLTELRDIVVSRRRDYISAVGHHRELALTSGMSDWERNQMDTEVDHAMRQCVQLIRAFQRQISGDTSLRASDEAPHFREVAGMLDKYLKKIAKIIGELRAVRVMKTQNMKKMSRLSTLVQIHQKKKQTSPELSQSSSFRNIEDVVSGSPTTASSEMIAETSSGLRKRSSAIKARTPSIESSDPVPIKVTGSYNEDEVQERTRKESSSVVDADLEQQLTLENEHLYAKLIHADDDIQRVEKQLNEIHQLQESFAEKVLEQEKDIEFINQAAVNTVENIREGNEQIREAIQNMASRRVILLFCLIALTFTLLFLDWYNP